jgi:hypothetical protein
LLEKIAERAIGDDVDPSKKGAEGFTPEPPFTPKSGDRLDGKLELNHRQ